MMTPITSIIIPVYNAGSTIRTCIESILSQTFTNFELILVNDGSTDNSKIICDEYAMSDKRIKIVNKENGGVSSARNVGLRIANGEWITFVDADDYLHNTALEHFVQRISEETDLIIEDAIFDFGTSREERDKTGEGMVLAKDFDIIFSQYKMHIRTSPWAKFYRKDIIRQQELVFDELVHHGEDLIFLYSYLLHCRAITYTETPDYYYFRQNSSSLTHRFNSYESEFHGYLAIREVIAAVIKQFALSEKASSNILWPLAYSINRTLNSIYHSPTHLTSAERIYRIKSLDLNLLLSYYPHDGNFVLALQNFLLRNRWYHLYDGLRSLKAKHRA